MEITTDNDEVTGLVAVNDGSLVKVFQSSRPLVCERRRPPGFRGRDAVGPGPRANFQRHVPSDHGAERELGLDSATGMRGKLVPEHSEVSHEQNKAGDSP